jgi:hypothetical protein
VSGATYRIDVEHQPDPQSHAGIDWIARITRLSDDEQIGSKWGTCEDEAVAAARAWLYARNVRESGRTLYVADDGQEVPSLADAAEAEKHGTLSTSYGPEE